MESIAKFFELNGQALINSILLSEDSSERVLHKLLFFTTRKALDIFEKKNFQNFEEKITSKL